MKEVMKRADKVADIMKCFSNKDKLTILCFLGNDERYVGEIFKAGNISQSQLSQYLGRLKLQGVLDSEKRGKEVYYKIIDKQVLELVSSMKKIFK